jgi:tetratricopeptide (TPR) repeat protein
MKRLCLFIAFTGFALRVCADPATLVVDSRLQLKNGSVSLNAGSVVDVVATDDDMVVVSYRSLRGTVPRTALDHLPDVPVAVPDEEEVKAAKLSQEEFRKAALAAFEEIEATLHRAEERVVEGEVEEANRSLLEFFPASTRTAAQAFTVGNLLFKADPVQSTELHHVAAEEAATVPDVLFEWALEQHRLKNYGAALKTYRQYLKSVPDFAPAYGLAAECALRTGEVAGAVSLWQKSEEASAGSLEKFESLVCEVNGSVYPDGIRKTLLPRVKSGDAQAATELLLLDSAWPTDWWNAAPEPSRLKRDLDLVDTTFTEPAADLKAARCVAQCALLGADAAPAKKREVLVNAGFVFDKEATLPNHGKVLSALIQVAKQITDKTTLRDRFGARILEIAKESKDPEAYRTAAHLYQDTDKLAEIGREAWDATGDPRFAGSLLLGLYAQKKLTLDHPLVRRAENEFPDNSEIAHVLVRLAAEAGDALEPHLIAAIKAEYTKFSSDRPGVDFPRPSAYVLRGYFSALGKLAGTSSVSR